jgi:hemerythrin
MALQWDDSLAVGYPLIDMQHRSLFAQFDELLTACDQGRGLDHLRQLFTFLDSYVAQHFQAEEDLMQKHAYPQIDKHLAEHRFFRDRLAALKDDLTANGPSVQVLVRTNKALIYWLTEHIRNIDIQLAAFLRAR